jgi:hypothetical protein
MYDAWRERRRAELSAARSLELLRLVMLYREAVGLDLYQQLPENLSFQEMIDTIINREAIHHEADAIQRAAAE